MWKWILQPNGPYGELCSNNNDDYDNNNKNESNNNRVILDFLSNIINGNYNRTTSCHAAEHCTKKQKESAKHGTTGQ